MRADGALRGAARLADVADRERGGIARDHGFREVRRDRREHLALEREVLGHRLDDELAALDASEGIAGAEARRGCLGGGLVVQTEPHHRGKRRIDAGARGVGMARQAVHAIARERVLGGDLRAHQPGTDDDDIHQRRS